MPAEGIMKHRFYLFLCICFSLQSLSVFAYGSKEPALSASKKLTVYTTKSFAADYGPGPKIAELFKANTGTEIEYVICKEGVLNRAVAEHGKTVADVLVGIDNHLVEKARKAGILQAYRPKNAAEKISNDIVISADWLLTPFDYGYFAFMYDTNAKIPRPKTLQDLTKPEYKSTVVILDPRTSTPGLGLIAWTKAAFKDAYLDFWKAFKPSIFTMSPKWSAGYGLFTAGEAPLALSYTSSLASHILYDKTERFQPLIFEEGHIIHIEGMGIAADTKNTALARMFIDFMLSDEVQNLLLETQFMFPAVKDITLPASFKDVPAPTKILKISTDDENELVNPVLDVLQQ